MSFTRMLYASTALALAPAALAADVSYRAVAMSGDAAATSAAPAPSPVTPEKPQSPKHGVQHMADHPCAQMMQHGTQGGTQKEAPKTEWLDRSEDSGG